MVVPLFAMPPPMLAIWSVAIPVVLLFVALFVSATRTGGRRSEQNRRAMLGLMAILCGPLVGASLAWLGNTLEDVHPANVRYRYVTFTAIGGIAGVVGGVAFAITGLFTTHDSGGKGLSDKPNVVTDEL